SMVISFPRITHPAFALEGDMSFHYHITRSLARSFDEGDPLPRWAGLLDGGNGDALFTFYPPLSYLCNVVLMKLFGIDVMTSLRIISFLIFFVAQASAYLFARAFFNRRSSLAASLLYVALPAFPLVGLKVCLFANAFALSIVPLAMLGARELLVGDRRARGLTIFALSTSGIILSHVITTYLCGIAIGLMTLIYLPRAGWRGVARLAGAGLLIFALTAFFLVPQQIEMKWVHVDVQVTRHDYHNYFLFAKPQDDSYFRKTWGNFNNAVSLITLAQTALTFLLCLACLPIMRKRNRMAAPVFWGFALAAFALFISLPWSEVIWRYLPGLKYIQFPWRFLPFVSLGCGLVMAAARSPQADNQSSWRLLKPLQRASISLLLTWVVVVNIYFTWVILPINEPEVTSEQVAKLLDSPGVKKLPFEETQQLDDRDDSLYIAYTANNYYRPKNAELDSYPPVSQPGGLTLLSGRGRVVSRKLNNEAREFVVECEEPVRARIETYHYPHWVARLDGREIKIDVEPGTGLMLVDLPAGAHKLTVTFEPRNRIETWARWASILTWIVFIGWIIWKYIYVVFRQRRFGRAIAGSTAVLA
ncbi:MAG: 6-pyruvoyl-tetrahydropterin synthase-related protein, partial [Blastocatellia bacterium]